MKLSMKAARVNAGLTQKREVISDARQKSNPVLGPPCTQLGMGDHLRNHGAGSDIIRS